MTATAPGPRQPGKPDDPKVVPASLRRSWGILVRRSPGSATPNPQNRPATLRVVRNYMTRVVRFSMPIEHWG
jgi:hypothetical protein